MKYKVLKESALKALMEEDFHDEDDREFHPPYFGRRKMDGAKKFIVGIEWFDYTACAYSGPIGEFSTYEEAKAFLKDIMADKEKQWDLKSECEAKFDPEADGVYGTMEDATAFSLGIYVDSIDEYNEVFSTEITRL